MTTSIEFVPEKNIYRFSHIPPEERIQYELVAQRYGLCLEDSDLKHLDEGGWLVSSNINFHLGFLDELLALHKGEKNSAEDSIIFSTCHFQIFARQKYDSNV